MSAAQHEPPQEMRVEFCRTCGRDNRFRPMGRRHFWRGELCRGPQIVWLRYQLISERKQ